MKRNLLILGLLVCFYPSYSQTGTTFWFVAPDVTEGHGDEPIVLRMTTYDEPVTITISMPSENDFAPITINLGAGETHTEDLTDRKLLIENQPANQILNKGLLIQSTGTIAAYYEANPSNNPDIFALKSENALGIEFVIPTQTYWNNHDSYSPAAFSSFEIVATEDNTQVEITPSQAIIGHAANVPFTISLNRGQTYSARATSQAAANHLRGSIVTSDKPIAITLHDDSGHNADMGGCKDLMGDQLIPVRMLGNEYIVIRGFLGENNNQPDRIYVCAVRNGTHVYLNSNATPVATLNRGEQHEITLNQATAYITSSERVYVLHVTGFGCEVGQAVLPALDCTGSTDISFTRSTDEAFHMLILCRNGDQNQIRINGNAGLIPPGQFNIVPNTNNQWRYARVNPGTNQVAEGESSYIRSQDGETRFHLGIINGGATSGCRYGYFSDFNSIITQPIIRRN